MVKPHSLEAEGSSGGMLSRDRRSGKKDRPVIRASQGEMQNRGILKKGGP